MIHAIFLKYHFTKLRCFVILTILSLIGFQATAIAQVQDLFRENVLRKYGAEDRLFVDAITEMIQDYEGYIWVSGRGGLCRFDGHEFYQFPNGMEVSHSIRAERVVEVFEDSQHNIWVGTLQGGLKLLDRSSGTFIDFVNADESKRFTSILEVVEDQEGQIWVSSAKGLGKVDLEAQKIEYVPLSYRRAAPYISAITIAESGQLWLGTTNTELLGVDPQTGMTRSIALPWTEAQANGISRIRIKYLLIDRKDRLWMNTSNGLFRAETEDLNTKTEVEWTLMTSKKVMEVAEDKDGNLWISTSSGLLYYDIQKDDFDRDYFSDRGLEELNEVDARNLLFDEQRNLWISTISGEMYQVLWNQIKPRLYPEDSFANGQLGDFFTLLIDENDLYFGTRPGVLGRFNPYTHQHEILVKIPNQKAHRFANYIKAIYKDQNNQLWLGTKSAGLWIYQLDAKQLISFEQYFGDELAIIPHSPQCIAGDQEGNILISCLRNGLMKYNPKDQSIKKIDCSEDMEGSCMFKKLIPSKTGFIWMLGYYERTKLMKYTSASDSYEVLDTKKLGGKREQFTDIRTIFEDRQANLWLGTDKGLFRLDQVQNNFIHYGSEVGLPETSVLAIQEDQKGQLWIASNRGIYAFDRTKNISTPVNTYISSFTFQHDSYFIHPETQQLFSANAKGLWAIYLPQTNNIGHTSYHAVFSKATYNYKGEESSEIDLFINEKSKIKIPHRAVGVEFQLTTLDHASSEYINYKYALQKRGFSPKPLQPSDWTNLQGQNKINLASLSAGHYILHVKASTQLGNWDAEVKQLRIHKLPPWWQSNWAYAIYINLLIFLIYKVYKYQLNRQYIYQEARKLKEIDEFKSRFFTNISHEFRTPLTIISGMIDQVRSKPDQWLDKGSNMIKQNTLTLLQLVNQILELRKLEHKELSLQLVQGDVVQYLRYISAPYQSHAENKNIQLHFNSEISSLSMDYDPEKMLRVISNLLSNAIKFTPEGGQIYLKLSQRKKKLQIEVRDTGIGIDASSLPHVFDRFYQIERPKEANPQGSGIGLALVKDLVELMKGKIKVISELNKGTSFVIQLPITQTARLQSEQPKSIEYYPISVAVEEDPLDTKRHAELPRLLIVEDNADMRQLLIASLEEHYQIQIARNGQEGIEQAIDQIPDLIISDVMMPLKDGYELCDTLKKDFRTSHIPIILLTAKADIDARLSGLEKGADVYLAKPFSQKELLLQITNLLKVRQQLQERYRQVEVAAVSDHVEDEFLQGVRQNIEANLEDADYDTVQLCKAVGLSKTQLYRKLKALTGFSTAVYIRTIRLKKAQELLMTTNLNVSEVAYAVGFKTPKYFSSAYAKEFGIAPSAVARKILN